MSKEREWYEDLLRDNMLEAAEHFSWAIRRAVAYELMIRGIDNSKFKEYANEAEHQDGFEYWIEKMSGDIDKIVEDYKLYIQEPYEDERQDRSGFEVGPECSEQMTNNPPDDV